MTQVSDASRAQLQRTADVHGFLQLLLIEHASWPQPLRLVNDTRPWEIGGDIYVALPFRIKRPTAAQGEQPRAQLQIDNVGRDLGAELEALPPGDTLLGTFREVSRATPTVVDVQFVALLGGFNVTPELVTCTLGNDQTLRQSAVRVRFDPANAPGAFAG